MSSTYGKNLKLSVFGQSHGKAVGMVLDGIPAGLPVDTDRLERFLSRRAPGKDALSSARCEDDLPVFYAGLVDGFTCGAPLAALIENHDVRSDDYAQLLDLPRPGHADYTAQVKYGGFQDVAGGGHSSGRLTAPLCVAGGLCLQWLEQLDIRIGAHIIQIGREHAPRFDAVQPALESILPDFPACSDDERQRFCAAIAAAHADGDSIGGRIECAVVGLPAGLGEPMFGGVENRLAQILYGIPGVKSVGFGLSEDFAALRGSESNDPFALRDDTVVTTTNRCGGILGGITDGMPLLFDVCCKPTPSIAKPQQTVSLLRMEETTICTQGRHDPCIALRAVPVVEAAAAIALYDMILDNRG